MVVNINLFSYGVTAGAEAFASSVVSGVEGVVVSYVGQLMMMHYS